MTRKLLCSIKGRIHLRRLSLTLTYLLHPRGGPYIYIQVESLAVCPLSVTLRANCGRTSYFTDNLLLADIEVLVFRLS
jgi:hypothetical protein